MFNIFKSKKPKKHAFNDAVYKNKPSSDMYRALVADNLIVAPSALKYSELNIKLIDEMMRNLTVSSPIFRLVRDLCGRSIRIEPTEPTDYDYESLKVVRERFKNVQGWGYFLEQLALTPFYGFCVFEKVFSIDPTDNLLKLKRLDYVPRRYIKYNKDKGWYIDINNSTIPITHDKFVLSVYNPTVEYVKGQSLFQWGMVQAYQDLNSMETQLREIQQKWGNAVPIFGYDPEEATTDEGRKNIAARAKMISEINNMSVIGVPLSGMNASVKDSFQFIDMNQLKPDLHAFGLKRLEDKIEEFLMGAKFSEGDRGSYARDAVQETEKNKVADHLAAFMSGVLNKLLDHDAVLYGYNARDYDYVLELEKTQNQKFSLEKLEAEVRAQQGDASIRLAEATARMLPIIGHLKFLGMSDEDITKQLETRIEIVSAVPAKELINPNSSYIGQNLPKTKADPTEYTTDNNKNIKEFAKSNKLDLIKKKAKKQAEFIQNVIDTRYAQVSEDITEQIKNYLYSTQSMNDLIGIVNLPYDYRKLYEDLVISYVLGYISEHNLYEGDFSPDDVYNIGYDKALNSLLNNNPELESIVSDAEAGIADTVVNIIELVTTGAVASLLVSYYAYNKLGGNYSEWLKSNVQSWYLDPKSAYWRTMYDMNIGNAYNLGVNNYQELIKDERSIGYYYATIDNVTTNLCRALNGTIQPIDSAFWKTYTPPNHYGCRSVRLLLSQADLAEYGLDITSDVAHPDIDNMFTGAPWQDISSGIEKNKQKIKNIVQKFDNI